MGQKPVLGIVIVVLIIFAVAARGEAKTINVAFPSLNMLAIAFTSAKDQKFYSQEGLDVQLITMAGPIAVRALLGGNVDFAILGGGALPPISRGAPLRIVFTSYFRPMYWLYAKSEIKNIRELKGKRVGVSGVGSGPALLVVEILRKYGLEGERDVQMIALGAMPTVTTSLLTGAIDAAAIAPPFNFTVKEAGFRELASFLESDFVEAQGSIVLRDHLFQSDPALVEKFVRATYKGLQFARHNRSDAVRILTSNFSMSEEDAVKYYDAVLPVMTLDGTLSEEFQRQFISDNLNRLGIKQTIPIDRVFDYSLVRKIQAELERKRRTP